MTVCILLAKIDDLEGKLSLIAYYNQFLLFKQVKVQQ